MGLPFAWDTKTIRNGLNFTLTTDLGDIDLLGEVAGGQTYQTLLPHSFEIEAFGIRFKCIDLPTLIRIKEAAERRKNQEAIAELRVLLGRDRKKANLGTRWFFQRREFVHQRVSSFFQEHAPRTEDSEGGDANQ